MKADDVILEERSDDRIPLSFPRRRESIQMDPRSGSGMTNLRSRMTNSVIPNINSVILNGVKDLGVIVSLFFLFVSPVSASTTTSRITIPLSTNSTLVISNTDSTVDKKIIISDHLSSTRVILNEDGTESSSLSYYPYGEQFNNLTPLRPRLREGAAIYQFNNRLYTGQRKVPGDNLYNYNARFYNPTLGVFTQPDTVEGPNRFAYVGGNPIMANDPSGHCIPCIIGIGALVGAMVSSPMSSTEADTPGEIARVQEWEASGGPEFNYLMGRMIPGVGQGMGLAELARGEDILGRDVSRGRKIMNVADIALMSATSANSLLGARNTAIQSARVAQYEGGAELLAARSVEEAQEVLSGQSPLSYSKIPFRESLRTGSLGTYNSYNQEISLASTDVLNSLKHEGVHALQDINGHPGSEFATIWGPKTIVGEAKDVLLGRTDSSWLKSMAREDYKSLWNDYDSELMAYASANKGSISAQIGGAMGSTSSRLLFNQGNAVKASGMGVSIGITAVQPLGYFAQLQAQVMASINGGYERIKFK